MLALPISARQIERHTMEIRTTRFDTLLRYYDYGEQGDTCQARPSGKRGEKEGEFYTQAGSSCIERVARRGGRVAGGREL